MNKYFRIHCYFWSLLFLIVTIRLQAQTTPIYYYVEPNGNDSNPGTELLPWKTLAKVSSMATAGVTVLIKQGTYNEPLIPVNSGTAEAPITFASYPGDTVTISGVGLTPAESGSGLIFIDGLSYIRISGLRVINSTSYGINVNNSSYITIEKNYVDSTDDSGIITYICSNVVVDANEVLNCSIVADQECISIAKTNLFEIKNNCIHEGYRIGIDIKVGSSNGIVCNNETYNLNGANGIYIDAWDSHEFNIDAFDNISHDNNIGIALSSEFGGLLEGIRVHHNIAYKNLSRGFIVAGWSIGLTHPLKNIKVYGNESYENGFGFEIGAYTGTTMDSIAVYNNLIYHNQGAGVRISRYDTGECALRNVSVINNTIHGNGTLGNGWDADNSGINIFNISPENMLIKNNIVSNNAYCTIFIAPEVPSNSITVDYNFFNGFRNVIYETAGTNAVYGDPLFVDSLKNDYHLQATSACIDKGDTAKQYNDPVNPDEPGYALYPAQGTIRNDMGAYGGPYASSWDLAASIAPPLVPTLISPLNGASGVPSTLLLSWDGHRGATSYQLQVSYNSDFSSMVIDTSITGQSYGIRNLANNTLYYWRVKASNAGGTNSYSSTWNFIITSPAFIKQIKPDIPIGYALYQNIPNPFNQITTIQFSLPKVSQVKLSIFNSAGMEIEVLVNQNLPRGQYRTQWIPNNNLNGVYFCQLKTSEFIGMKKLLLHR